MNNTELPPLHTAARNVVAQFNDPHVSLASVARYVNELEAALASQASKGAVPEGWKSLISDWECGFIEADKCVREIEKLLNAAPSPAQPAPVSDLHRDSVLLQELLARIHRDGGQHTASVGIEQSAKEADSIVAELHAAPVEAKPTAEERYWSVQALADERRAQPSPAQGEAKPFAYFHQPSSYGPFIECKPDEDGAFPAYRGAQGEALIQPETHWTDDEKRCWSAGRAAGIEEAAKWLRSNGLHRYRHIDVEAALRVLAAKNGEGR